ncbi:MAG: response regulator transcription factor [Xanthobacteraceae bacterium]|nr:response regulator transcription factor [Xanthobacteraceae bacterium]
MKVLVVDDHPLIREALRGVFHDLKDGVALFEASDSRQAMQLVAEHNDLELVLLDINLPDRDGFSVLSELREQHPGIAVVVLSGAHDRSSVTKALDLGAVGFIPKTGQREVMLSALQLIIAGGIYIPPEILAREEPSQAPLSATATRLGVPSTAEPADLGLTERQVDVLALMMQGKSNKAICRVLDLAEPTVKNHVTAIFKALKVINRTEAAIAARELGWDLKPATKDH